MRSSVIATTAIVVATLVTCQQVAADFGSLLDKIPVFKSPDRNAEASAEAENSAGADASADAAFDLQSPAPPTETAGPGLTIQDTRELAAPGTDQQLVDQPQLRPLSQPRLRSPIPPPHVPDESVGLQSEESLIEADAEHAAEMRDTEPLPPSIESEAFSLPPENLSPPHPHLPEAPACNGNHRNLHHHGHTGGAMITAHAAPAPYIYAGPGLPPPASLESFSRTPDCYRGLWDGYAEEKMRRCAKSHAHLHGYCDCHRVQAPHCHHGRCAGECCVGSSRGTCAKAVSPRAVSAPGVTR